MKFIILKKLLISTFVISIGSLSFAGISGTSIKHGYLTFAIPVQLTKLDPVDFMNAHTKSISALIYEPLIIVNSSQELQPGLAKSWYIDEDGKAITLTIDRNHRFSDNKEVTASDVIDSFNRLCCHHINKIGKVRGLKGCYTSSQVGESKPEIIQLSQYKVKFNISSNPTTFLYQLTSPSTAIVQKTKNGRLIGSGPYVVESKSKNKLTLGRNSYYHDFGRINNQGLIFVTADGKGLPFALNNKVDGALMYRQESLGTLNYKGYKLIKSNPNITEILVLNNQKFPFNQPGLRKALASEIYNIFDSGCISGAHHAFGITPYGIGGSLTNVSPVKLNSMSPSELFEKTPDLKIKKTIIYIHLLDDFRNNYISNKIIEAGKKYNLNFKFQYHRDYFSLIKSYQGHTLDAFIDLFVFKNRDAYPVFEFFSKSGENLANINVDQIDKLLNEAGAMPSSHGRFRIYRQINEYLQSNGIVIPLLYMDHGNLLSKCLTGIDDDFVFNPFNQLTQLSKVTDCVS